MTVAATRQQAERRTGGYNPERLIEAAAGDGYCALAGAVLALAITDCKHGDLSACVWLVTGPGRSMLSLLLPSSADEAETYRKLRALAPDVIQLPMFDGLGART